MATILEARDLAFGYESHAPLFEGWSAAFHRGEFSAVTGPSGRGKSTLLYLLGLMLAPTHGHILLDGEPVEARSDRVRAQVRAHRFGFVFQDAALDATRTILDNVLEGALYRGEDPKALTPRALGLLERFGVELRADARPGQVSGGQAQRISLCRALLGRPDVLLADEPTGNLDAASAELVIDALHHHADQGAAVIVVTHDPAVAARCDRGISL